MNNEFAQLVEKAAEMNWCTKIYCTTCLNSDFRRRLEQLAGGTGFGLVEPLCSLEVRNYTRLRDWDDCLQMAFMHLPLPEQREKILEAWLEKVNDNIRFADVVIFYIVRSLPSKMKVQKSWIEACASLACRSEDESLVESLAWTLRSDISKHPDLFQIAKALSASSFKVRRALGEAGVLL